ncbi:hypothetical protein [Borreliella burgdorferi]|nr:hypothetical protein [Borreliella burgdorferi]PRR35449.1 hypothetical protein CV680_06005 [Borreliella burgdorferi]
MNSFNFNFLFLFILIGCNVHYKKDFDKFSTGMEHSFNDFEYANNKKIEIEEREILEREKRDQLANENKIRSSIKEFKSQIEYYRDKFQYKIKRLEEEIEEETQNLNFFVKEGHKRSRAPNVYQFHQDEIIRLTNEKKEVSFSRKSYIQLKDNSIKHHKVYIDAIEAAFPNIKYKLIEWKNSNIERYKANIERYKANIERYTNGIKMLYEIENKDLDDEALIVKFRSEFYKLEDDNMIEENKNLVEIWKEDIENCQYSIISYEVDYNRYNNLKSEVDSLEALNLILQDIKNSIEEKKLEINMLKNRIEEKELRNKELEEKLKEPADKQE